MRKLTFAFVFLLLPSVLTAAPTIALFLDDHKGELSIRSKELIVLSTDETYWWFGRLDLFRAVCQYPRPPHATVCGELDVGARWVVSTVVGDFCSFGNAPDTTPKRSLSEVVVAGSMYHSVHQKHPASAERKRAAKALPVGAACERPGRDEIYIPPTPPEERTTVERPAMQPRRRR